MTQWFRGRIEGHYVGTSTQGPVVCQFGSASRYKIRIYRAMIRNIEVLDADEVESGTRPTSVPEGCFYQAKIEDVRLIGIRPRTCFEGSVYDVAFARARVSKAASTTWP